MLDIQSMILSQRVAAFKLFIEDYSSHWKNFLGTLLGQDMTDHSSYEHNLNVKCNEIGLGLFLS